MQHLSEKDITAFVKNGKIKRLVSDTGIDSENKSDDSSEIMASNLSKVPTDIDEVMAEQANTEHLHLQYLASIKQYVLIK
jgi:hypothetical protein